MKGKKRPDLSARNRANKNRTYEEMYGEEKAQAMKNITSINASLKRHTEDSKNKISLALTGKRKSPEHIKHSSEARIGKKHSLESNIKRSLSMIGDKCYNWKGGISGERYDMRFKKELKNQIRKSYGFCCMQCLKSEKDLGYTLSIHHIDFNKKNTTFTNLLPLCKSCHSKTNHNREHWKSYFNVIIIEQREENKNVIQSI